MGPLRLNGPQLLVLRSLLRSAFGSRDDFTELLMVLDKNLGDFAADSVRYPVALLETLHEANAKLWWRDLLREACNAVPDPGLRQFAEEVGFAATVVQADATRSLRGRELELKIRDAGSTFDIVTWRQRISEIENRVCRIEVPALQARGTGFLVAPDLVLTNYHVIESVHKGATPLEQVLLRFDYKILADGISVGAGKPYALDSNWLVDHSPYSAADFDTSPSAQAGHDELDYALLRLESRAGDEALEGTRRGWIGLQSSPYDFMRSRSLYIVQHPDGKPMQIALDSDAVIMATPTRVRYTTTTEPGSSGSPCFGPDWQWVALHHSGDPKYWKQGRKPEYNQGIPVESIVKLLASRGKDRMLGGGAR